MHSRDREGEEEELIEDLSATYDIGECYVGLH